MAVPFDISRPNVARVYDCLLGGKNHYASDREAAAEIMEIEPGAPLTARQNRDFLRRAVQLLAGEAGIRQFLDIGSGLPTADNVHEVAQSVAPGSRVVYVDNDPVVLSHARALLVSHQEGQCDYVDSDLRDTGSVLTQAARTLDFTQPVAVLLIAVLHFLPDDDEPREVVRRLMAATAPGSYLVISHAAAGDLTGAQRKRLDAVYAGTASGGVTQRWPEEIRHFFDGLDMADPGIVPISAWRPVVAGVDNSPDGRSLFCGGVGRKPREATEV